MNFKRISAQKVVSLIVVMMFSAAFFQACDKDEDPQFNPGYVNIFINPNGTEYAELNAVGGWVYLYADPPSRGIIVYRLSQDEFKAYDRMPTYEPNQCCLSDSTGPCTSIIVNESGIIAVDTCNGSEYILLDGSVSKGPASVPLFAYRTVYDGDILQIFN